MFLPDFLDDDGDFLEIVHAIDIDGVTGLRVEMLALPELLAYERLYFFLRLTEQQRTDTLANGEMVLQYLRRSL